MKNKYLRFIPISIFAFLIIGCSDGSDSTMTPSSAMDKTTNAVKGLAASGYQVTQGNVFLFTNSDCAQFIEIFDSCFGNNAAAPYVIPQPPTTGTYVDPYYAEPLNTPGPDGVNTNVAFRLDDQDALITVVKYPPKGAYFGYQSYVFTSETSNYPQSYPLQVVSPDIDRYEIFGSVGNDINNIIVQNQAGSPWNGEVITYVTTSNQLLADQITSNLVGKGINQNTIMVEKLGSNVRTGRGKEADDLVTLMRYALPQDEKSAEDWYSSISNNVVVFKVNNSNIAITRYPQNQYTARSATTELQLIPALDELASLLESWSMTHSALGSLTAVSTSSFKRTSVDNIDGIPTIGLVGSDCINKGTICAADNQDTSTYAFSPNFDLSNDSILFVAGVDHNKFNNSSYISLSIYNAAQMAGIASSSQTNYSAVGFNSGSLTGSDEAINSAEYVLREIGLYDSASDILKLALPNLYINLVSKNCSIAIEYCIDLDGNSLIPDTNPPTPINMYERSYIRPGATTGASPNVMVYPRVIGPGKQA
jgi:hypothetical protein